MRTMRVQRILLLLSSLIPLSKSYCSTPGLSYLPFIASPFSLLCSMLSSSPQPSYFRLEPKVDWTPNCGAGLGQIEKDTLVPLLLYNCITRVLLSRNLRTIPHLELIFSAQLSMTSVRVSWAGLLETSVCADFLKVLFLSLMFWLLYF